MPNLAVLELAKQSRDDMHACTKRQASSCECMRNEGSQRGLLLRGGIDGQPVVHHAQQQTRIRNFMIVCKRRPWLEKRCDHRLTNSSTLLMKLADTSWQGQWLFWGAKVEASSLFACKGSLMSYLTHWSCMLLSCLCFVGLFFFTSSYSRFFFCFVKKRQLWTRHLTYWYCDAKHT